MTGQQDSNGKREQGSDRGRKAGRLRAAIQGAGMVGAVALVGLLVGMAASSALAASVNLLNVSYDPTREFYRELNAEFAQ